VNGVGQWLENRALVFICPEELSCRYIKEVSQRTGLSTHSVYKSLKTSGLTIAIKLGLESAHTAQTQKELEISISDVARVLGRLNQQTEKSRGRDRPGAPTASYSYGRLLSSDPLEVQSLTIVLYVAIGLRYTVFIFIKDEPRRRSATQTAESRLDLHHARF